MTSPNLAGLIDRLSSLCGPDAEVLPDGVRIDRFVHVGIEIIAALRGVSDEPGAGVESERLPTLSEAAQAAQVFLRCNGHDLDIWTGGEWPDDVYDAACRAIVKTAVKSAPDPAMPDTQSREGDRT
ncbi:hypothetical protein ASG43_03210 [Aureimonas sp. Leaf454]|uniref:hypothetical protein n=1 Tax=Aureimonas sp. Leaf454 TaxID=1736381 RepID=UPI0006F41CAB|nr:hypothetical protein [Aureimonas sp. Leaf454]KQT54608.1 hypothetical protein ASG43_03210 [Aureimonas sp. Leaf454]